MKHQEALDKAKTYKNGYGIMFRTNYQNETTLLQEAIDKANKYDEKEKETQDFNFIRVPKKIKLSSLIERLQTELEDWYITWQDVFIVLERKENEDEMKFIVIEDNKIIKLENEDTVECEFFPKWLYELYFSGTEIEVDL